MLTDPELPWTRTDGSVVYMGTDEKIHRLNDNEEDYGPMWRDVEFSKGDIVDADPRIGFLRLLAGCTHEEIEALFDHENLANERTYAEEIKQWNKIERERIMVGTKEKQEQLAFMEERAEEVSTEYGRKKFTHSLFEEFTGKLGVLLNVSGSGNGTMASLAFVRLVVLQYELCEYFIQQMNNTDETSTYVIDSERLAQFHTAFVEVARANIVHGKADAYRKRAVNYYYYMRSMSTLSGMDLRWFATDIFKYLFIRDTLLPNDLEVTPLYFDMSSGTHLIYSKPIRTSLRAVLQSTAKALFENYRTAMSMQYLYLNRVHIATKEERKKKKQKNAKKQKDDDDDADVSPNMPDVIFDSDRRFRTQFDRLTAKLAETRQAQADFSMYSEDAKEAIATTNAELKKLTEDRDKLHTDLQRAVSSTSVDAEFTKWTQGGFGPGTLLGQLMTDPLKKFISNTTQAVPKLAPTLWAYGVVDPSTFQRSEKSQTGWFDHVALLYVSQFVNSMSVKNSPLVRLFYAAAWNMYQRERTTDPVTGVVTITLPSDADLETNLGRIHLLGVFPKNTLDAWRGSTITFKWTPISNITGQAVFDALDKTPISKLTGSFEKLFTQDGSTLLLTLVGNLDVLDLLDHTAYFFALKNIQDEEKRRGFTLAAHLATNEFALPTPECRKAYTAFFSDAGEIFPHAILIALVIMTRNEGVATLVQGGDGTQQVLSEYIETLAASVVDKGKLKANLAHLNQMAADLTPLASAPGGRAATRIADTVNNDPWIKSLVIDNNEATRILLMTLDWLHSTWPTIAAQFAKDDTDLRQVIDSIQSEIYRLSTGNAASITDQRKKIKDLYAPPLAWQMRPEFTGRLKLSPRVVAALDEGLAIIRKYVDSLHDVSLDGLIMSPMESGLPGAFARFVAALMNKAQLTFPHTYNKDIQYAMDPKLRAEALHALRGYRVQRLPDGTYVAHRDSSNSSSSKTVKPSVSVHYF